MRHDNASANRPLQPCVAFVDTKLLVCFCTTSRARRDMASFPSSWIIEPKESVSGNGATPRAKSPRRTIKRPTTPPRSPQICPTFFSRCSPPGSGMPCKHDDLHPTHPLFEFVPTTSRDGFPFTYYGPTAHAPYSFDNHNHTHQWCTSTMHALSQSSVVSMTPCPLPEDQNPSSRYSAHFPSSWLLSPQSSARCTSSTCDRPAPRAETASSATAFSVKYTSLPVREQGLFIAEDVRAETQASFVTETEPSIATDQLLSKMKGEPSQPTHTRPDKEEEIGSWMLSIDANSRARAHVSVTPSMDAGVRMVREAYTSSSEDDIADACGLGDAPHLTQDDYDAYSIYSTSTVQERKSQ